MATKKTGPRPAALAPKVVRALVDKLATDDAFRALFQDDPASALAQVGYVVGEADGNVATCLQMSAGASLASKETFARDRTKMEEALIALPFSFVFDCPPELQG